MTGGRGNTLISVIMAAYNAEPFIKRAVETVLAQTYGDFELIVVDDASTDRTPEILASFDDPRLFVYRNPDNLGPVGSRNRASKVAKGQFIAIADADDLCAATRFERQIQHFAQHPRTKVLATEMSTLCDGRIERSRMIGSLNPVLVDWMLHIGNPVGHPSVMFRADLLARMGEYLREDCKYAEDFDFLHRAREFGDIQILPDHLVTYRRHGNNLTTTRRSEIAMRTESILAVALESLIGAPARREAALIARHLIAAQTVKNYEECRAVGTALSMVHDAFITRRRVGSADAKQIAAYAARCWWQRVSLPFIRNGGVVTGLAANRTFSGRNAELPPRTLMLRSVLAGAVPAKETIRRAIRCTKTFAQRPARRSAAIGNVVLNAHPVPASDPASLYVVVDTEAEFDWSGQFDRRHTRVASIREQGAAQEIFNRFGLRPIYVVDYPVASQPDGYEPLKSYLAAHQCVIGAHLHPWTTPPFEEEVNEYNSYQCNLHPSLERRKMETLRNEIVRNFGVAPLFFKAGRYGVGPSTFQCLQKLGFAVDLSFMPHLDLRKSDGPDFRQIRATPYSADSDVLILPMTRGQIGMLSSAGDYLQNFAQTNFCRSLRLPGILSRLKLLNTVTLTPEGFSTSEQKELIRKMVAAGDRHFVLHYHSPSLVPGNTPYVTTVDERAEFLRRIEDVCRFFFDDIGGLAGNPADLVAPKLRQFLWPDGVSHRHTELPAA